MKEVKELILKGVAPFTTIRKQSRYAAYDYEGELNDEFIARLGRMPTPAEIAAIVDTFSANFGWTCNISGKKFNGTINID